MWNAPETSCRLLQYALEDSALETFLLVFFLGPFALLAVFPPVTAVVEALA